MTRPTDQRADSARSRPAWRTLPQAIRLVLAGRTFRAAAPVALIVGVILSAVNEGSAVLSGSVATVTLVRITVNFAVPFAVASIGFLMACRVPPD